jgi:hypothetical protein
METGATTMETKTEATWTLDGERIEDFEAWLRENADAFTVEDALRFAAMVPGEERLVGGGAWGDAVLRREA